MTGDFSVTPKPQNKKSTVVMCVFFGLALASLIVSMLLDRYRGVVGLAAFAFLVTAILMYTKYVSVVFHYDIIVTDVEEPMLVIRQTVGKRNITLCNLALADIKKVEKETAEQRKAHKTEQGVARYVCGPTLDPAVSYRLTVQNRYQSCEIIIEGTDEFSEKLLSLATEAAAQRTEDGDL